MAPFVFANSLPGLIEEVLKFHLDLSLSLSCAGEDWKEGWNNSFKKRQIVKMWHNFLLDSRFPLFCDYVGEDSFVERQIGKCDIIFVRSCSRLGSASNVARWPGGGQNSSFRLMLEHISHISKCWAAGASKLTRQCWHVFVKACLPCPCSSPRGTWAQLSGSQITQYPNYLTCWSLKSADHGCVVCTEHWVAVRRSATEAATWAGGWLRWSRWSRWSRLSRWSGWSRWSGLSKWSQGGHWSVLSAWFSRLGSWRV